MVGRSDTSWKVIHREQLDSRVTLLVETDGNSQYCANLLDLGSATEVPGTFRNAVVAAASGKAFYRRLNPPTRVL